MSQNSISCARHAIAEVSYGAYGEQHLVQATAAPCRQRGTAAPAPLPPPRWELGSSPRCLPFRMIATELHERCQHRVFPAPSVATAATN
jgi:hypothetical protein